MTNGKVWPKTAVSCAMRAGMLVKIITSFNLGTQNGPPERKTKVPGCQIAPGPSAR
jgi:hypothetical protein